MGGCGKHGDKYGSNGAGAGNALQVIRSDGADIWEQDMGVVGGRVKSTIGIPSSGSYKDCGEFGLACGGPRVVMAPSGQCARDLRGLANKGIHP